MLSWCEQTRSACEGGFGSQRYGPIGQVDNIFICHHTYSSAVYIVYSIYIDVSYYITVQVHVLCVYLCILLQNECVCYFTCAFEYMVGSLLYTKFAKQIQPHRFKQVHVV